MAIGDLDGQYLILDAAGVLPLPARDPAAGVAFSASALNAALRSLHAELASNVLAAEAIAGRWKQIADLAARAVVCAMPFAEPSKWASDDVTRDSSALAPDERSVALRIRSDDFFRVRRVADLGPPQLYYELVKLLARIAPDLAAVSLGAGQVSAIATCLDDLVSRTCRARAEAGVRERAGSPPAAAWGGGPGAASALHRWRSGHQLFFLATQAATHYVQRAKGALDASEPIAASEFDQAALHVRGMSAALWYASAMPSALYIAHVRPLMHAESCPGEGFSGLDSYDNLAFAFAVEALRLRLLKAPPSGPAVPAAERLFEAFVEHHEHHVLVASAMVGTATSLHRDADQAAAQVPAVEILRGAVAEATEQLDSLRNALHGGR